MTDTAAKYENEVGVDEGTVGLTPTDSTFDMSAGDMAGIAGLETGRRVRDQDPATHGEY